MMVSEGMLSECKYCHRRITELHFECLNCGEFVHLKCIERRQPPSGLSGDVFYGFTCKDCGIGGTENFERVRMNWVDAVSLIMYNLSLTRAGTERGYFHRDKQIKKFLNTHYFKIFPYMKTKRKSYLQILRMTLKRHTEYFEPLPCKGKTKESVWYRLAIPDMLPNQPLIDRQGRKCGRKRLVERKDYESSTDYDSDSRDGEASSIAESQLSIISLNSDQDNNMYSRSYVKPTARLSEFLFAGEEESCSHSEEVVDIEGVDLDEAIDIPTSVASIPSLLPMSNVPNTSEAGDSLEMMSYSDGESTLDAFEEPKKFESLFERSTNSKQLPWVTSVPFQSSQCSPMTIAEELYTLSMLSKKIAQSEQMSVAELRLHRKLAVRKTRRERSIPVFNLDAYSQEGGVTAEVLERGRRVLDRFVQRTVSSQPAANSVSFWTRLMGHSEQYTCFVSPLTQRILKPFIRRDYEARPLWLKLQAELRERTKMPPEPNHPIDYCYVRQHHIPAVNSIAEQYFWPGINLSECLQYPDFSCVVLYKKLVVAFAFLVPDVGYNQAYISFIFTRPEWRRAGIASFMLYHLVQSCMGRDITLHVSATNPALLLYQKFGFKVEEFVQEFYDKYLPVDSTDCRHALFLRLAR